MDSAVLKQKKLPFRRYFAFSKATLLETTAFRTGFIAGFIGSVFYTVVVCYLWKAIFDSSAADTVNGMTYTDTLVYVALAGAIMGALETFLVWSVGREIQSGEFSLNYVKPVDYFTRRLFSYETSVLVSFVLNVVPIMIIVGFISHWAVPFGWNSILFIPALAMATIINFSIDFLVATLCLYTESSWGINIIKEVIVLLLSGATVPLAFFPETLRNIMMCLPFQAIYNTPLKILISDIMPWSEYARMYGIQLIWLILTVLAAKIFFKSASRVITVNGG